MIIEERTKKAIKLLFRFLKQKNLLVEFKKDLNPKVKLHSIGIICDEQISLEELIQIRLNRNRVNRGEDVLKSLIDKTLFFRIAKYKDWGKIDDEWEKFYLMNKTFLN